MEEWINGIKQINEKMDKWKKIDELENIDE